VTVDVSPSTGSRHTASLPLSRIYGTGRRIPVNAGLSARIYGELLLACHIRWSPSARYGRADPDHCHKEPMMAGMKSSWRVGALAAGALVACSGLATAAEPAKTVTFSKDVAPI